MVINSSLGLNPELELKSAQLHIIKKLETPLPCVDKSCVSQRLCVYLFWSVYIGIWTVIWIV